MEKAEFRIKVAQMKRKQFSKSISFYKAWSVRTRVMFHTLKKQNQPEYGGTSKWSTNRNT